MFGRYVDFFRRTFGQTFRKSIGMDFKYGKRTTHKNPHALPMNVKQQLLAKKRGGDWDRIHELEAKSPKPYGRFARGKFLIEKDRKPVLDIPDLTNFYLKPYVAFLTPKVDKKTIPSPTMRLNKTEKAY